jgi:hypothetical protein
LGIVVVVIVGLVLFVVPFPVHAQVASITVDWTAPGDDGNVGTATTYQMRWSATRPDTTSTAAMDTWWGGATNVTGLPAPKVAGSAETFVVNGPFTTGQTYYFVMKSCDEVPNCSGYSNVGVKILPDASPPARIIDLRTR